MSGPATGQWVDMDDFTWNYALDLALKGEPKKLTTMLRTDRSNPSKAVRYFFADLIEKKRLRRGLPGRLSSNDLRRIRLSAAVTLSDFLPGDLPSGCNTERRLHAFVVKKLSVRYSITPGTVRDIIARRGRYADK